MFCNAASTPVGPIHIHEEHCSVTATRNQASRDVSAIQREIEVLRHSVIHNLQPGQPLQYSAAILPRPSGRVRWYQMPRIAHSLDGPIDRPARSPTAEPHGSTSIRSRPRSLRMHHSRLPSRSRIVHDALRRRCTAPARHLHTYPSASASIRPPLRSALHLQPSTSNLFTSASLPAASPQTPRVQAAGTRDAASELVRLRPTSHSPAQARLGLDGERAGIVRVDAEGADRCA
ncbi:hypothetical protein OH77DRAFT_1420252 [Trametes cingulata]|nr:hypothetical protein OH77DRAFT_1420252 [Trametes cingulata]